MTTLEIVLLSLFAVVLVSILFLFIFNTTKIQLMENKKKEQAKKDKTEVEKPTENTVQKTENKIEVKVENSLNTSPTVAVVTEDVNKQPIVNEESKKPDVVKQKNKSINQQINELSPELKTILFTDIIKPKF